MSDSDACREAMRENLAASVADRRDRRRVAEILRIPLLVTPELSTLQFLAEREKPRRRVLAACVDDESGTRCLITAQLIQDRAGTWRLHGKTEGPCRPCPEAPDPSLSLGAQWSEGTFWAAGRVQSAAHSVARVRLVWDDGHSLAAVVQNDFALFLDDDVPPGPATAESYDHDDHMIGQHLTLTD